MSQLRVCLECSAHLTSDDSRCACGADLSRRKMSASRSIAASSLLGLSVSALVACGGAQSQDANGEEPEPEVEGSGEIIMNAMYGVAPTPERTIVIDPPVVDTEASDEPVPAYGIPPEPDELPPLDK